MFPGSFYLLAMWYRREESQKRYTFFFSSTSLAGAFGGLIATGIGHMDHIQGKRNWQWIFILGKLLTTLLSYVLYLIQW
jgi:MFS family permease